MNCDDLNNYAGELATEMQIYSMNRLENVRDNVNAIITRLRRIKPKKRTKGKKKLTKTIEEENVKVLQTPETRPEDASEQKTQE